MPPPGLSGLPTPVVLLQGRNSWSSRRASSRSIQPPFPRSQGAFPIIPIRVCDAISAASAAGRIIYHSTYLLPPSAALESRHSFSGDGGLFRPVQKSTGPNLRPRLLRLRSRPSACAWPPSLPTTPSLKSSRRFAGFSTRLVRSSPRLFDRGASRVGGPLI